jgi:hypothetical protein
MPTSRSAPPRPLSASPANGLTRGALLEAWPDLTVREKRDLMSTAIDAVFLRPVRGSGNQVVIADRVLILWRGEAPADLPRRGHRVPLAPFAWPDGSADMRLPVA